MHNTQEEMKCEQCEVYKSVITEVRKHYAAKTLRYVSVLAFAAALSIAFQSYLPCISLLLLLF